MLFFNASMMFRTLGLTEQVLPIALSRAGASDEPQPAIALVHFNRKGPVDFVCQEACSSRPPHARKHTNVERLEGVELSTVLARQRWSAVDEPVQQQLNHKPKVPRLNGRRGDAL